MDLVERVACNLRRIRTDRGWSQDDLAEASGLDRTYISGIERGKRNPTLIVLEKIAVGLGVDPLDLIAMPRASR
jgi:transcriptional regulator with XRE-family HTH domain